MRNKYKHKIKSYLKTYKIPYNNPALPKSVMMIDLKDLKGVHREWIFNIIRKINVK